MASKQQIKASKYHMRALGTAALNSNTINIILHNSYLPCAMAQMATNIKASKYHMRALGTAAAN